MAQIQNPITGRTRKTAGGMVFYTLFGKNTMRSKSFAYRDKNSTSQQAQRSSMSLTQSVLSPVKAFIAENFSNISVKKTPYSIALGNTLKNAFTGSPATFNPTLISFGISTGSQISDFTYTQNTGGSCDILWYANTADLDELAAKVDIICVNSSTNQIIIFSEVAARSAEAASINFPVSWYDCMVSFYTRTTDFSTSVKRKPRRVVKFRAGNDLSSKVK